jgi:hypothetical protein
MRKTGFALFLAMALTAAWLGSTQHAWAQG